MINGGRQPSYGGTSRMNREVHVRICERLGVQLPGATRQRYGKGVAKTTSCVDLRTWTAMSKEKTQVAKPRGRKYRSAGQGRTPP